MWGELKRQWERSGQNNKDYRFMMSTVSKKSDLILIVWFEEARMALRNHLWHCQYRCYESTQGSFSQEARWFAVDPPNILLWKEENW